MRIVRTIALWTLQILVGLMFVLVGEMKFQDPSWARNFARWGYPRLLHGDRGARGRRCGVARWRGSPHAAVLVMTR